MEVADDIDELSRRVLRQNFRPIDSTGAKIILLESAPRVLAHFP